MYLINLDAGSQFGATPVMHNFPTVIHNNKKKGHKKSVKAATKWSWSFELEIQSANEV